MYSRAPDELRRESADAPANLYISCVCTHTQYEIYYGREQLVNTLRKFIKISSSSTTVVGSPICSVYSSTSCRRLPRQI